MSLRWRPASDAGDTLIEVLVALAVLSIGVVTVVGGLSTQVIATGANRDQAQASSVLNDAAEFVKAQSFSTVCALTSSTAITASSVRLDSSWTVTEGPATDFDSGGTCSGSTELAKVTVSVSGHGESLSLIVARRP